jgi:starch synthase
MKVLIASSEAVPYAKTGGLADVTGTLVNKLRGMNIDARLIVPMYRGIRKKFGPEDTGLDISVLLGRDKYVSRVYTHGKSTILIECDEFFDRKEIYGASGTGYDDNAFRFIFFSRALLETCMALDFIPDVIHCNDWQTGLVPLYMKTIYSDRFRGTASLFTIHNLGYQGIFPESAMTLTGLGAEMFNPEVIEFHGKVNLMKAGITSADAISTVSENYAREILTPEYGVSLDGVLRNRKKVLTGIINGIDTDEWDPARDELTSGKYDIKNISGKEKCRNHLVRECNFGNKRLPLVSILGRLSSQKGIDVFLDAADGILSHGVNMVILGKGDRDIRDGLRRLSRKYPANISLNIGFDETLAHIVYAGSDILLIPSHYEPCGLAQMIGMRYGTVPVARATGGLVDTIEDFNSQRGSGTGFLYSGSDPSSLEECLKRAFCIFSNAQIWQRLVEKCMKMDFSWNASTKKYAALYRNISRKVAG